MRNLKRNSRVITMILSVFIIGMVVLILKIYKESSFYIVNSGKAYLGYVYDRKGDILFDQNATPEKYDINHFLDVGNIIGDASPNMSNTLVYANKEFLNNYSFLKGSVNNGKSAIYTTLNHDANKAVYNAFGYKNGTVIAYNYLTGEILVCVSKPSVNPMVGYENLEEGSLLCKAFYKYVPGSTQKIATVIAALENLGVDKLYSKSYNCSGEYYNLNNQSIKCHKIDGHGVQNISQAFANSCNPFFAQLVADVDLPLDGIINSYTKMGYAVNKKESKKNKINGIIYNTASTNLKDKNDFDTQWGCIGQGDTEVSPCQLMIWQSAIANETGISTNPQLISYVTDVDGNKIEKFQTNYSELLFSSSTAIETKKIMLENGLNYTYSIPGYSLGVKSGTAEIKDGKETNSFLVGFNNDPNLPIAFCVVIENKLETDITTEYLTNILLSSLK